jgi:hypothetical protein
VVYVQDAPAVDIETYPSVLYGGVAVYYVGGHWYQRGPRGWAYYRQEPPELGHQREEHWGRDHDPRWAYQQGVEHRRQGERVLPAAPRPGVTEAQPPDHRVPLAPSAQLRREGMPAPPAPVARPRRREETAAPSAPKRAPGDRRSPVAAPVSTPPERR